MAMDDRKKLLETMVNRIVNQADQWDPKCTQIDTAEQCAVSVCNDVRFLEDRNCFCYYDGKRWQIDTSGARTDRIIQQWVETMKLFFTSPAGRLDPKMLEYFSKYDARGRRKQLIDDIKGQPNMLCRSGDFDKKKNLLNVKNGMLNLDTGELRPHKPDDLMMMMADVDFRPEVKATRFERFLDEIMQGDKDMIDHLQEVFGYALSGGTEQERFFVLYGPTTRNGKTTLINAVLGMMGDYGKKSKYESFQETYYRNSGGAPSEDIARLKGARFVTVSEPAEGMVLDVARMKNLTGGDVQTARFLHQGSFEYKPCFKIFVDTNHLPQVTDDSLYTSNRVEVIAFNRHFDEAEQDLGLKDELATDDERSGILNWALAGYQRLKEKKYLAIPDAVKLATVKFREENDKLLLFMRDEMDAAKEAEVTFKIFYQRFKEWCQDNGYKPMKYGKILRRMDEKGMLVDRHHGQKFVYGYQFKDDEERNPFSISE